MSEPVSGPHRSQSGTGSADGGRRERPARLFLALELPAEIRRRVAEKLDPVRDELPETKWVRPDLLHLTLVFLGDVERSLLPPLAARLTAVAALARPFEARLGSPGTFPPRRPARVAWLAFEPLGRGGDELVRLRERMSTTAEETLPDFVPERRPFHAHVTVGRPRSPWRREAIERFEGALRRLGGEPFPVDRAVLFESHLPKRDRAQRLPGVGEYRGPHYVELASLVFESERLEVDGRRPEAGEPRHA